MAVVSLVKTGWVFRRLRIETESGVWVLEYRGYYLGSEAVFVDGRLAQRLMSRGMSMVPRFDFAIGPHRATLHLAFQRMWTVFFPKVAMALELDGVEVYRDGREIPTASARFS